MKAFEVFINGHRICLAGVGDNGVLTAIVNWVGGPAPGGDTFLSVGGLDSTTGEFLDWQVPSIGVGSEVLVRVAEAAAADPPDKRATRAASSRPEQYRRQLRELSEGMTAGERRGLIRELVAELEAQDAEPGSVLSCGDS